MRERERESGRAIPEIVVRKRRAMKSLESFFNVHRRKRERERGVYRNGNRSTDSFLAFITISKILSEISFGEKFF